MQINEHVRLLNEASEKAREKRTAFARQVLLMSASLLGILVSLYKRPETCNSSHILFVSALSLLALGILLVCIAIYQHASILGRLRDDLLGQLQSHPGNTTDVFAVATTHRFYVWCEKTGYVSLVLSLIALVLYVAVI